VSSVPPPMVKLSKLPLHAPQAQRHNKQHLPLHKTSNQSINQLKWHPSKSAIPSPKASNSSTHTIASPHTPVQRPIYCTCIVPVHDPADTLYRWAPITDSDPTACGLPQLYDASKEWKGKKVVLFSVPGSSSPTPCDIPTDIHTSQLANRYTQAPLHLAARRATFPHTSRRSAS
jgi:hypothetical protein